MSAQSVPYLTPQEYLEIEEKADYKSEYFNGQMWPLGGEPYGMAGRPEHNLISVNCIVELSSALKGKCLVFNSDQRVRAGTEGLYTYASSTPASSSKFYPKRRSPTIAGSNSSNT